MDGVTNTTRDEEEGGKLQRRLALRSRNNEHFIAPTSNLDSSLKRHTALIKRMKLSLAADNREQILKDIDTLSLEKYIEEMVGSTVDGISKCRTDKDVWSAVEIISALHRRFPKVYTPSLIGDLQSALAPPARGAGPVVTQDIKEKDDQTRLARQRPILRVASELCLVGIICDAPGRSGGEWIMKVLRDLLSNDPSLTYLPLLASFLKYFSHPFLEADYEQSSDGRPPTHLVEKETQIRFRKMCEGYFEKVSKKLVLEFKRLQEQDKRNHEAYVRSGEIFDDRQQAYEKMTKSYEKLLAGCQSLSELLSVEMPSLQVAQQQSLTIGVTLNAPHFQAGEDAKYFTGSLWEDEEEEKFYEDIPDLSQIVPKSALGISETTDSQNRDEEPDEGESDKYKADELLHKLKEEMDVLNSLEIDPGNNRRTSTATDIAAESDVENSMPRVESRPPTPPTESLPVAGPSQLLTTLLARLPDAPNASAIDEIAVEFVFLSSKAARKRLVKHLAQIPKNRTDLIPNYSRLVAILNKYMPDIGLELISILEEEFRYLNRKRNVRELSENRTKNIAYISALTKFRVVRAHTVLHMIKVFLDDFTGVNVENVALMLEGCGRFLLRSEETRERMSAMLELMKRKQSLQHFDHRQISLLENAYYQCNPPDRVIREEKQRRNEELFIRHLVQDVLNRKNIDKVLRLFRKLDWKKAEVYQLILKYCSRPWKMKYSNINCLAMLVYDFQRYHPGLVIEVVDQVLDDVRRGMEWNVYTNNQHRIATAKFLGELYIYRVIGSGLIFDTLWSLVTFGHPDGRPHPGQISPSDTPDDYFRLRIICVLLDTCGMCFDRGSQKHKLDQFLTSLQLYVLSKDVLPTDIDFMYRDSLEALRPELHFYSNYDEASRAVDQLFSVAHVEGDGVSEEYDSGEESVSSKRHQEEEDEEVVRDEISESGDRPGSPDAYVLRVSKELQGPSEEAEAEFAKELAKLTNDISSEGRKMDKRTVLAMWDTPMVQTGSKKKKAGEDLVDDQGKPNDNMKFSVVMRRGHKQQVRELAVPLSSALAVHTRTAQLQDKAEQEQLKRLVLDYEQRDSQENP